MAAPLRVNLSGAVCSWCLRCASPCPLFAVRSSLEEGKDYQSNIKGSIDNPAAQYCAHDLGRLVDTMSRPFKHSEVKCLMVQVNPSC